jgi:hypothetical protein
MHDALPHPIAFLRPWIVPGGFLGKLFEHARIMDPDPSAFIAVFFVKKVEAMAGWA